MLRGAQCFAAFVYLCTILFAKAQEERVPSHFKVGDEILALPEVFSKLDFNAESSFARADDLPGQLKLRASRFWGRLYIDGWPQPIQFFRAHFGVEPPMGRKVFVFAEPRDACTELVNAANITSDHVLLVRRGTCTFGEKAKHARLTSASGVVIINNEPGLDHLPGPDAHDIDLSVVSIPQPEGHLLETYFDASGVPLEGYIVPINCQQGGTLCEPATYEERSFLKGLAHGGTLELHFNSSSSSLPAAELPLEYLLAHFGVKVPSSAEVFPMALAKPGDACAPLNNDVRGKVVLVRRGGCPFVNKAETVQAAGGSAVIVASLNDNIVRMGVEPRYKGLNTVIPVLMVSRRAYGILVAESSTGGSVGFRESSEVSSEVWEALEKLSEPQGWPRSAVYASKKYDELLQQHSAWPDRVATIKQAYNKLTTATAGTADGTNFLGDDASETSSVKSQTEVSSAAGEL